MTPDEKLEAVKGAWRHQIVSVMGTGRTAQRIVELADLNGLFDLHKKTFADQDAAFQNLQSLSHQQCGEKA